MFNTFPISFSFDGKQYRGEIRPLSAEAQKKFPVNFQVFLNHAYCGLVKRRGWDWETDSPKCALLIKEISNNIYDWYQ
jgi:hypothetical protein